MVYTEYQTEKGTRRRYAKGNAVRYVPLLQAFLVYQFPPETHKRVLDAGAGEGKFYHLLRHQGYAVMDGLEIHEPYVERFGLREKYHELFVGDAGTFDFVAHRYDLVILGDLLEHLSIKNAVFVLQAIQNSGAAAFVSVPFLAPQGRCRGNPHEAHQQDDLTPDVMAQRYPSLSVLWRDDEYGIYIQEAL